MSFASMSVISKFTICPQPVALSFTNFNELVALISMYFEEPVAWFSTVYVDPRLLRPSIASSCCFRAPVCPKVVCFGFF